MGDKTNDNVDRLCDLKISYCVLTYPLQTVV